MDHLTLEELNDADGKTFVEILGGVYESSPWVAERARADRPFSSVDALHDRLSRAVEDASRERKLDLLRAHPDLGEQTEMTDTSEQEQASAGLDELSPEQYETFQRLNETYRERFGFPFIMAVRGASPDAIQAAMERRIENSEAEEFRTALEQVHEIARLRLEELLS
ncbi:2-oxo-4-hydroxy-4-carboxy-5-ureidoimidazoline decarboxylase [Halobellus rubicundus]|uniref:2-oxo-4-hydroxy-4-carboxy-5-ureidoimidazoline decarboxylase n=1 Tax=Halobellus rubicundus TaxID=2996466 RepID=A0ABD5MKL5_9EURY